MVQPLGTNATLTNVAGPPSPPPSPELTRSRSTPAPICSDGRNKRRRIDNGEKNFTKLTIEEVWNMADEDILNCMKKNQASTTYEHYDISVERRGMADDPKRSVYLIFDCKYNDASHGRQSRQWTSSTTSNLKSTKTTCEARNPDRHPSPSSIESRSAYTEARHRTIIALRSARSKRSFHMVEDELYKMEVELLRPGTVVPSADTVRKDVIRLYEGLSLKVRDYFQRRNRELHLIVDGWSAPISESFLGADMVWEDNGKIYSARLEFIRLTASHTGAYLSEELAKVLKRFGIAQFMRLSCVEPVDDLPEMDSYTCS